MKVLKLKRQAGRAEGIQFLHTNYQEAGKWGTEGKKVGTGDGHRCAQRKKESIQVNKREERESPQGGYKEVKVEERGGRGDSWGGIHHRRKAIYGNKGSSVRSLWGSGVSYTTNLTGTH